MKNTIIVIITVLLTNTASLADRGAVPSILNLILDDSTPYNCPTDVPTVTTPTGRVWMDLNLGASQVATSKNDSKAYGYLYQWGRFTDGHQERSSEITNVISSVTNPNHRYFITSPKDWINPFNDDLWQGVEGINNPCPLCFRLPTKAEWDAESKGWLNSDDAFDSQPGGASRRNDFVSHPVSHGLRHPANIQQVTAASALAFS